MVLQENGAGVYMVNREVEESLDLVGMQVGGDHAVASCGYKKVGHQLGSDGDSGTVLAVLTGPAEVGDDGNDLVGRCPAGCVNHEQELKEVVQRRKCGLHDECGGSADGFVECRLELAVAEVSYDRVSEFEAEGLGNLLGQIT